VRRRPPGAFSALLHGSLRLTALDDLGVFVRFARRLPRFLRETMSLEDAERRIAEQLARRHETFLDVVARTVFSDRENPYRPLFDAGGVEEGDVATLVREEGLEGALGRLYDAGVYVTLDEFKGRAPIERPGVSVTTTSASFDNPLLTSHYAAATGGTRGVRRRVSVDLDLLEHETADQLVVRDAFDCAGRPSAVWRPVLPSSSGVNNCLRQSKLGEPVAAWFNPYIPPRDLDTINYRVFTGAMVLASRMFGARIAAPEACGPSEAKRVAGWLADRKREGTAAVLDTQTSLGVRVCHAARDSGLDIVGTVIGVGGEPYTEEKAAVIRGAGCRAYPTYSMTETGRIALACGEPQAVDDMHVLSEKLAVLQRDRIVADGTSVLALYFTALLPGAPKLMINVESDDYGDVTDRPCGCPFGALGLTTHISGERSYEKLTAEGNHFLGSDLVELVDRVLPERFGGGPTDYQLVEEEVRGLPKVSIVARPTIGPLDDGDVVDEVLDHLGRLPRNRLMTDTWREGRTLRVVRREPYVTAAGKILPLHLLKP
jgi:hypothetical protein